MSVVSVIQISVSITRPQRLPMALLDRVKGNADGITHQKVHILSIMPWWVQKAGSPGDVKRSPPGSPLGAGL